MIYPNLFRLYSVSVRQNVATGTDPDLKMHPAGTGECGCLDIAVNESCDDSLEIHKRLLMTGSFISDEDLSRSKSFKKIQ